MKKFSIALTLSGAGFLNSLNAQTIASTSKSSRNNTSNAARSSTLYVAAPSTMIKGDIAGLDKRGKARVAILPLLRAVFNTRWKDQEVLLTVDAGWRNDSLSIEYKYYKGTNLLALNENMLIEKIYFTVKPEEIDAIDTENDEFQFLYLRNKKKRLNVHHLVSRPSDGVNEETWRSSLGFPVRTENLPIIIRLLKDLRIGNQQ
ncbi:hypothetical protein [Flavitalea sp.]|nr:hypothetical protein [Flavitalea sp.]